MTDMDKKILDAFDIAAKTHENIGKLIKSCKGMCEKSGYKLLTKEFIRWWTTRDDDDPTLPASASWSTRWFILLFKRKDDEKNTVYMMEVNLTVPNVTAAKFIYKSEVNYSNVNKDFDSYSWPVNMDDRYSYKEVEVNGFTFTKATLQTYRNKYWANQVLFNEFPLSEINAGNVQEKIFGTFDKLAELKS